MHEKIGNIVLVMVICLFTIWLSNRVNAIKAVVY